MITLSSERRSDPDYQFERRKMGVGRRWSDIACHEDDQNVAIRRGDFTLDDRSKRILVAGNELRLTRKEYSLLAHLMRNYGTVFSSRELANLLWANKPKEFIEVKEREIKQFIYTLRKKIAAQGGDPRWIHSVRGFGYCITIRS